MENRVEIRAVPYSLDELKRLSWDCLDQTLEESSKERRQEIVKKFTEKLKNEKEKFQNIFETENGSLYFITKNGESLRIKKDGNEAKIQPICRKVFFVEEKTFNELMENRRYLDEYLLAHKIKTCPAKTGAHPFEFQIIGFPEIIYEVNEGELKIHGTKYEKGEEIQKSFVSGFHLGHKIINIIK